MTAVIDVHGLTKSFNGVVVVNGVDLNVEKGEIFGFLGPNGSGKTTTIRMLCGLLTPDSGTGHCLGFDILTEQSQEKPNLITNNHHLLNRRIEFMLSSSNQFQMESFV